MFMSDDRKIVKTLETKLRKRINWIDSMRGIAILLVILGHCVGSLDDPVNRAILSFHMPLFFFISGLISGLSSQANAGKQEMFPEYCKKKIRGIMIPQAILFLINLAFLLATRRQQLTLWLILETWFNWFFTVLFICSLLIWWLRKSGLIFNGLIV
jgi:fucose 4-O-acetylase-like acetyltransferase